ncbi:hypothetical protein ACVWYH_003704 [Bradyrhizobium sp. GM24.11]
MFVMTRDLEGTDGEIKGGALPTLPLSSPDLIGDPSIPETTMIESRSRGVLDAPVEPGHDTEN